MLTPKPPLFSSCPVAVVGAGDLASHLYRREDVADPDNYHYSVFRFLDSGATTQNFRPADLRDIVKLCQVLAFEIATDGCIPGKTRGQLLELVNQLDAITQKWSDDD